MDLQTVTMDRDKARRAFLDYRAAVRERHDEEDEQIMRVYKFLAGAEGRQVLELSKTMRLGGTTQRRIKFWNDEDRKSVV